MDFNDFPLPPRNENNQINTDDPGLSLPKSTNIQPKTVIRRPRNILRVDHLISKRGIAALPDILKETKFKGKGNELEDLKLLLFKSKHWAHRLFPGLTFEDFVNKTEHLGNKRAVKNFLLKIRTDQPLNLDQNRDIVQSDDSADEAEGKAVGESNDLNVGMDQAALKFDMLFHSDTDNLSGK